MQLWRYKDPILGDCTMPVFNNPTQGKELIPTEAVFDVDVENGKVSVRSGGKSYDLGRTVTYLVVE